MRNVLALIGLAAGLTLSTAALGQSGIKLGLPGYGGNGCPSGSVSATLSPDATSLSLLFDSYSVEAGGETNKRFDRKSCNIAIPVQLPQGISISVLAIDYRGYNNVPSGATSEFNVEYFFAGARGPSFKRTFKGPVDEDYLIHNELEGQAIVWSPCGAEVNLRTNSSIKVTSSANKQVLATVDSEDVSAAIIYQLQWKQC